MMLYPDAQDGRAWHEASDMHWAGYAAAVYAAAAKRQPGEAKSPAPLNVRMNESLRALRDPGLDLASVLCQLILDIRLILVHPDLQNHVKLAAIQEAVDELAPPPGP